MGATPVGHSVGLSGMIGYRELNFTIDSHGIERPFTGFGGLARAIMLNEFHGERSNLGHGANDGL